MPRCLTTHLISASVQHSATASVVVSVFHHPSFPSTSPYANSAQSVSCSAWRDKLASGGANKRRRHYTNHRVGESTSFVSEPAVESLLEFILFGDVTTESRILSYDRAGNNRTGCIVRLSRTRLTIPLTRSSCSGGWEHHPRLLQVP
jgi:hypothetical protein